MLLKETIFYSHVNKMNYITLALEFQILQSLHILLVLFNLTKPFHPYKLQFFAMGCANRVVSWAPGCLQQSSYPGPFPLSFG